MQRWLMKPLEPGVCSWSIDRRKPIGSIRAAVDDLGVRVVHLGFFDAETLAATTAGEVARAAEDCGVTISATFAAFPGEVYKSIATVAATGGYLPDKHFESRLEMTRRVADLSAELNVSLLAVHAGTVPEDGAGDAYKKLANRAGLVADMLAERGLTLLLETGRESAQILLRFIESLGRDNVAINYDPGNMVIYGTDDPVEAVAVLRGRIAHVHLKDALASDQPGVTFGTEVTLGAGDASIPRVASRLRASGYAGPLVVERTGGRGDPGTLADSVAYLRALVE